ncbi:hypothetical protein [Thaumasiovibrio subtropicus]|uniref:hypothetical protein n=1 Tax=Thaumasiovibrio subtropicus TaxID=1891207 RepID=UPI00131DB06E|nr:hypothetical protein [Thaumasiovibrio subtropicus]
MLAMLYKNVLLEQLEDEYELRLISLEKNKFGFLSYLRKEFNYSALEAKEHLNSVQVIKSSLSLKKAKLEMAKLDEIDVSVEMIKTGSDYIKGYDPDLVEKYLSSQNKDITLKDYYTTKIPVILYDKGEQSFFLLIEDNDMFKSCIRYLIEVGQIRNA